jgi:ligand-binding sensor domain-containing protein/tRNA A-37 threonylcarbamoyl transferase component Bud32
MHKRRKNIFRMASRSRKSAEYRVRIFLLCGLILLLPALGLGQHYPILPVPGSPHDIYAMMQDSKSRIWIGTKDDVFCFDGSQFYSLRSYGLPGEFVNSLAEDGDGGIWIGTEGSALHGELGHGGLYRYQDGHVDKIFSGDILSIVQIAPSVMLASLGLRSRGSFGDLYRFVRDQSEWKIRLLAAKSARYITVNHEGTAFYPCPGGACALRRDQIINWTDHEPSPKFRNMSGASFPDRILQDRFGCLWARNEIATVMTCPGASTGMVPPSIAGNGDPSAFLAEAPDGSVLVLGNLEFGRPNALHVARARNGLPADMNTALIAGDGTIWIGAASGLYRFMHPFQLEYWDQQNGVEQPYSILQKDGRIYASSAGISVLDQNRQFWTQLPNAEKMGQVVSLLDGPGNTLYSAALIYGVTQLNTRGRILAQTTPGPGGASLARDADGNIWLGGDGISRVLREGAKIVTLPEKVGKDIALNLKYDAAQRALWACHWNEVAVRQNQHWRHIGPKDGLLNDFCQSVAVTPNGDAWVGYGSFSAFSLIQNAYSGPVKIKHFYSSAGSIGDAHVNFLDVDRRGWLWRGSDADYVATPEAARAGEWIRLDGVDGIPAPGGNQNAFYNSPDGSIWFGSGNTIVHFSPPDNFASKLPTPPVFISGFTENTGKLALSKAGMTFTHGGNLTAHLGSLQFDRRAVMHFRYRLPPEQISWMSTSNPSLQLANLSWGTHTLQLQAQLSNGPWSEVSEQTFTVLKPIWLSWPALAGYVFACGSFAIGGRRWRKKLRERSEKAFPELAEWRLSALSPELQQLNGALIDGRFEAGRILARGGFATVAEGRDLQQEGRPCAIKIFRQELVDKDWMARRFQQEVLALSKIQHPNVVRIYGNGTLPGGAFYLVMEFIDGVTLRELLEIGKLTPARVASYLRQAGDALDEIHARGICHRDLKPENLMIRNAAAMDESLVLIDFSIAIVKDPDETLHGLSRAAGTIYYMAPEQAIGYADSSTDIYSLAKIVIEMLTGERLSVLLPDASMDLPDRVRELLEALPMRLSSISVEMLSSALEFDPSRRPKNAGGFAEAIAGDLEAEMEVTG